MWFAASAAMRLTVAVMLAVAFCCSAKADYIEIGSAYGFKYGHGSVGAFSYPPGPPYGDFVYIDGPLGRESFYFNVSSIGAFEGATINQFGQMIGHIGADGELIYYAAYGIGGSANPKTTWSYDNFYVSDIFHSLDWHGPVQSDDPHFIVNWLLSYPDFDSIDDTTAYGHATYFGFNQLTSQYEYRTLNLTWALPDPVYAPTPEPSSIVLLVTACAALAGAVARSVNATRS